MYRYVFFTFLISRSFQIPIEDLEGVLASLGQKPKMSELAELLSALQSSREMNGEDATHFGFDDFCQVLIETLNSYQRIHCCIYCE
jgi:Ca2+-binding EF-hand superfamily protein